MAVAVTARRSRSAVTEAVDVNETCDDGNANANDGCDGVPDHLERRCVLAGFGLGGGVPTQTLIAQIRSLAYDSAGNLYIGDSVYLRRLDAATHELSVVAGTGVSSG